MPEAGTEFKEHHDAAMNPPDAPYGLWNMAREDGSAAGFDEQVAALESIGYLDGSEAAPQYTGVVKHEAAKAQPGLNFYTSGHAPAAFLMDMQGKVLHEWRYELKAVWPDYPVHPSSPKTGYWRRAYLYPNGDVLAIFEGIGIIKVDRESKLVWAQQNGAHHDLHVLPDGTIWVLTRKAHAVPEIESRYPTLEDFATLMDAQGETLKSVSLLEAARNSGEIGLEIWRTMQPAGDVMHTNAIVQLDGTSANLNPALAKGNLLLSMLYPNAIVALDVAQGKFVWSETGVWRRQHHPRLLRNGNMMVFDNRSTVGQSAILELDSASGAVVWEYRGNDAHPFYSYSCGSFQELENGNFLVAESDSGRAFEITRAKELVWDFYNPHRAGDEQQYIATLFDLYRVSSDYLQPPLP